MIRIFREDTQWAITGNIETAVLKKLMHQLPKGLQGDGSRVVTGNDGLPLYSCLVTCQVRRWRNVYWRQQHRFIYWISTMMRR